LDVNERSLRLSHPEKWTPDVNADEDELPEGWAVVPLEEAATLQRGFDLPVQDREPGQIPVLASNGPVGTHNVARVNGPGVVTGRSGTIGKVQFIQGDFWPLNTTLYVKDFHGNDPKFIALLLTDFQLERFLAGTGVPTLNRNVVHEITVRLAPLAEQRRIVSKVEALLPCVNAARQLLAKVPAILKRFRQSVLAAACSGRLTADWREENRSPTPEGVTESDLPDVPDVPATWIWRRLSTVAEIRGGVTKGRKFNGKCTIMLPYLRVANVQDGFLDLAEIKQIEVLPEDKHKYALAPGDILFTEGGDRDKLGRGTVWSGEIPGCIHQNHIFRARLVTSEATPQFVSLATKSEFSRDYFFHNASQTVNLASLNMTMLSALPIPLPPLPEQHQIVRRVEALFRLSDAIEKRVAAATARADKLTQAILAKAFRGELVPTEAELARREGRDYEPASVLLERIRAERAQSDQRTQRITGKGDSSRRRHRRGQPQ
jgi:type I restriction enzyme S subunit